MVEQPRARGWIAASAVVFSVAVAAQGCSELGIDEGRAAGHLAASATIVVEPVPEVEILSPPRGSFLAPGPVTVRGVARVASGSQAALTELRVDGAVAAIRSDGSFEATVQLDSGLNLVRAHVTDSDGRVGARVASVLAGEWNPLGQAIPGAVAFRLNDPALAAIAGMLEDELAATDLTALTRTPIYDGMILSLLRAQVRVERPAYTGATVRLDAETDGLHVDVELQGVTLDVVAVALDAGGNVVLGPERVGVAIGAVTLGARLLLERHPDGTLGARFEDLVVDLRSFQVSVASSSTLVQAILPLLQGWIGDKLGDLVTDELNTLQAGMDQELAELLSPSTPSQYFGKTFTHDARVEWAQHDAVGFGLSLSFDAPVLAPLTPLGAAAPGSLRTPGVAPPVQTATHRGVILTLDDDALNRSLHTAWAIGVLEGDVRQFGTPANPDPMAGVTAADLLVFLPELRGVIPPAAPVDVRFKTYLPPLVEFTGAPDLLRVSVGDVAVEVLVDRGAGLETLFEVALHLRVGATIAQSGAGLQLSSTGFAEVGLDVVRQPIARLDVRRLHFLAETALVPVIPHLLNHQGTIPVPPAFWSLQVFALHVSADPTNGQRLLIEADLVR